MMTKAEAVKWLKSLKQEIGKTKNCSLWHYAEAIDMVIEVMAEPKTGEWVSNHDGSWNCSECGLRVFVYAKGNYCPNCGTKMYKGGDSE